MRKGFDWNFETYYLTNMLIVFQTLLNFILQALESTAKQYEGECALLNKESTRSL